MYNQYHHSAPPHSGIHGGLLEVTVVGCTKLKDTEWISRQDPYVCLEYGSTKFRTRTCTDGHKNPTFQEKFNLKLIEGIREINVQVWNSNTLSTDDFIGSGKIQLNKVLSEGFDDNSWTLHSKSGRYAGEVRLIMHYANSHKPAATAPPPLHYGAVSPQLPSPMYYNNNYSAPPQPPQPSTYPHNPAQVPPNYNSYPPVSSSSSSSSSAYNYNPPNYPYNNNPSPPVAQPYYSSAAAAATPYPPPPPPPSASPYPPPIYPPRPYY